MTTPARLAHEVEEALAGLAAPGWRERKSSVEILEGFLSRTEPGDEVVAHVRDRLLDGLVAPNQVDGRAACHEVLISIGRSCLPIVRARLTGADPATARRLVDLLVDIGDEDDVARLIEIVGDGDGDPNLRASAVTGLGAIGGPEAEACLIDLLGDPSDMLRVYALDALRVAGAVVPVDALEPLATAPFTRQGAATLLGASGDAAALVVLLGLLDDPMSGVRAAAAQGVVALDEALSQRGRTQLVATALQRAAGPLGGRIRALFDHDDRGVRTAAITLATMARDVEALGDVLAVMEDPLLHERALAMVAVLGAAAAPVLARLGGTVDAAEREHLLRLVGALDPDLVTGPLLDLLVASLEDVESVAAEAAAESLGYVGGRSCLGGLYRAMASPGPLGDVAADALAAVLMRITPGRYEDLDLIVGAAWPQSGAVAQNLCRVVGRLQAAKYVSPLVAVLGSPDVGVRVAAAVALGHLPGEHAGISALSLCLADEEPQVRAAACRSLGTLRAAAACQSLLGATSDPSALVRAAAVAALVSLDNPVTLGRLRAIISEDPVPTVVVQAIAGLGRSALDQDLTMLMSLCMSEDHEVVKAAARALQSFALHRATAALLGLLEHERWDVRWAAAEVLGRRADATAIKPLRELALREPDATVRQALSDAVEWLVAGGAPR
jgi:HEAT repeat protein